jgi:hypothetical protein
MSRRSRRRAPAEEENVEKKRAEEVEKGGLKYVRVEEEDGVETYRIAPKR